MNKKAITISFILLTLTIGACNNDKKNIEGKYASHQTYNGFLEYLEERVDTINSEFDRISFVRNKVAELIDGGAGAKDASRLDENWASWNGVKFYDVFYNNMATVECGGSAHFLNRVYKDLGYNSETYDMGCASVFTHQVTLVQNPINKKFFIQDAFFNSTFQDVNGNDLNFQQLIKLLLKRKEMNIRFVEDEYEFTPDFDTTGLTALIKNTSYAKKIVDLVKLETMENGKLSRHDTSKLGFKVRCIESDCFEESRLPDEIIYLYLLPLEGNSKKVNDLFKNASRIE